VIKSRTQWERSVVVVAVADGDHSGQGQDLMTTATVTTTTLCGYRGITPGVCPCGPRAVVRKYYACVVCEVGVESRRTLNF
jgi:hypothetical protein